MKKQELLVVYETEHRKEILRDFNPLYVPVETNLVSFKNVKHDNIYGDLKTRLFYVSNVEYQVPNTVVITLT